MRRNGHKTTSGVKVDLRFDLSVPDLLYVEKFKKLDHDFMYFWPILCCACAETARILLPVKFSTPNLKSPWAVSYSNTNFGGVSAKIYTCFERKTAFIMHNFQNLGLMGDGVNIF